MQQGTQEWIEARLGKITASRFSDCLANGRGGGVSKTLLTYLDDLVCEHLTRRPASTLKTFAMEWGQQYEPVARLEYERASNREVRQVGFVQYGQKLVGCSPDGFVGDDGLIEIKCPLTPGPHLRVVEARQIPDEHVAQVQGNLWITSREWCDFVSYHEHFPEELQMVVVRVDRDEAFIRSMEERIMTAEALLYQRLGQVLAIMNKGK